MSNVNDFLNLIRAESLSKADVVSILIIATEGVKRRSCESLTFRDVQPENTSLGITNEAMDFPLSVTDMAGLASWAGKRFQLLEGRPGTAPD